MISNLKLKANESLKAPCFLNEEESIAALNCILVGYEHLECLDRIAKTTYFNQEVKLRVNQLNKALINVAGKGLSEIWGCDDTAMFNLLEHKKQLIEKISTLRPELQSGVDVLLDEYFSAPALTLHRLGIRIINRDK